MRPRLPLLAIALACLLVGSWTIARVCRPESQPASAPTSRRVLIISVDGLDLALRADMPTLRDLLSMCALTFWVRTTAGRHHAPFAHQHVDRRNARQARHHVDDVPAPRPDLPAKADALRDNPRMRASPLRWPPARASSPRWPSLARWTGFSCPPPRRTRSTTRSSPTPRGGHDPRAQAAGTVHAPARCAYTPPGTSMAGGRTSISRPSRTPMHKFAACWTPSTRSTCAATLVIVTADHGGAGLSDGGRR